MVVVGNVLIKFRDIGKPIDVGRHFALRVVRRRQPLRQQR